jgi:hypothetical protein
MAILSKVLMHPQERFDLEDFEQGQIDQLTDAKFWTREFLSEGAYILKGFAVSGLGAPSPCSVSLTDATLINSNNTGDFSWFTAPTSPTPLSVTLQPSSRNYLELELSTVDGTPLTKAFWDPSADGGNGAEFQQIVDTITDLDVNVIVSTTSFSGSADRIPLAIVDTDGTNTVKLIIDKRPLFFRLGTTSDSLNNFNWLSQLEPAVTLTLSGVSGSFTAGEILNFSGGATATLQSGVTTPLLAVNFSSDSFAVGNTVTGATSGASGTLLTASDSFTGADKNIKNFKNALDAVMTEIKRIKGTNYWYEAGFGSVLGEMRFINSVLTQNTTSAFIGWDGTNVRISDNNGTPTAADNIGLIRIFGYNGTLNLRRQDGTGGSSLIPLSDGQVLYVELPTSGNRNYSGVGAGSTNYKTIGRTSFVLNDSNYWIAYREGGKIYVRGMGELETGEEGGIGDTLPVDLMTALGLDENDPTPNYTSDIRGSAGESFLARISTLTSNQGDYQEDRSAFIRSNSPVVWTGTQLQFTDNIVLEIINSKIGTTTLHTILTSGSPLNLTNGQIAYITVDRTTASENVTLTVGTSTPAQVQANKDIFVLFKRIDISGQGFLFLPFNRQVFRAGQSSYLGASGSGSGITAIDFHDPLSTTLPTGTSVTIDGVSGVDGDLVLYTNLSSGNNRVYKLGGVGVSLTWTAQFSFSNGIDPSDMDLIAIRRGNGFADQIGKYTGTAWQFNKTLRYFDGANYVEMEAIKTSTLTASTTDNLFSVSAASSENWEVHYSILRGSIKESGILFLNHNGTVASVSQSGTNNNGDVGIEWDADINAGNVRLRYSADASGPDATIKYFFFRWSDAVGGPNGIPSYSGISATPVVAAGNVGDVQFKGSGGGLAANAEFTWDDTTKELNLNGLRLSTLRSAAIANNVGSPTTLFSIDASSFEFATIEFSIKRGTGRKVGRIFIAADGPSPTVTGFNEDWSEPLPTGVTLSASISGSLVNIQYISDNSGPTGTMKYHQKKWD